MATTQTEVHLHILVDGKPLEQVLEGIAAFSLKDEVDGTISVLLEAAREGACSSERVAAAEAAAQLIGVRALAY